MKAQSISLNAIVVAALALLVLIVLALIFTGKIKMFGSEAKKCGNSGGMCESLCEANEVEISNTECPIKCCLDTTDDQLNDNNW
jgi:hypothetical protein